MPSKQAIFQNKRPTLLPRKDLISVHETIWQRKIHYKLSPSWKRILKKPLQPHKNRKTTNITHIRGNNVYFLCQWRSLRGSHLGQREGMRWPSFTRDNGHRSEIFVDKSQILNSNIHKRSIWAARKTSSLFKLVWFMHFLHSFSVRECSFWQFSSFPFSKPRIYDSN